MRSPQASVSDSSGQSGGGRAQTRVELWEGLGTATHLHVSVLSRTPATLRAKNTGVCVSSGEKVCILVKGQALVKIRN